MKIAVIGGGVMGCASALALAKRGAEVVVLERAVPGAEASSAAAGILGAQAESHAAGPMLDLFVRARGEYPAWAEALRAETGIDIGYRASGALRIARDERERERLAAEVEWQRAKGLSAELLDGRAAHEVEPELSPEVVGAAHFPEEAQVDPPALLRALVAAASRAGAAFRAGATVQRVLVEKDRCVGVKLED